MKKSIYRENKSALNWTQSTNVWDVTSHNVMIIAYVHKCGLKISMSAANDKIVGNHTLMSQSGGSLTTTPLS